MCEFDRKTIKYFKGTSGPSLTFEKFLNETKAGTHVAHAD